MTEHETDSRFEINVWHPQKDCPGYSISARTGGWMPGSYETVEAAILGAYACEKSEKLFVLEVQQPINHINKQNRLITEPDITCWLDTLS